MLSEDDADVIRRTYEARGEWAAVVELRRLYKGVKDNADALRLVRTIVAQPRGG
ncbi:hypothetical protein [Azospirillum canadense]|uniref:hypothetical protein n=1 Tax=Azospirillum canadense TaxID=403962 RepID=UPI00222808A6|nr:hypothetical protein [Azospirillum canadense]MCW2240737.1 hypothetical protein [Azospirillum canadense]